MIPKSIIEEWMFSTVRIITTDALDREWVATGFIFGYPVEEGKYIPFLVTNRHVIENQMSKELHFIAEKDGEPDLENTLTLPVPILESHWYFHPNSKVDVAIMLFGRVISHVKEQDKSIFFRFVNGTLIPKKSDYEDIDAMEDIFFIGYPDGLYDKKNNTPIIRKGSTATHPNLDFDGEPKYLIDATVFGGSSGSPVFIVDNNIHWGKVTRKPQDSRILFVGIVAKNKRLPQIVQLESVENETDAKSVENENTSEVPVIHENFHLGVVFKPHTIMETIETAAEKWKFKKILEVMEKRKEKEKEE